LRDDTPRNVAALKHINDNSNGNNNNKSNNNKKKWNNWNYKNQASCKPNHQLSWKPQSIIKTRKKSSNFVFETKMKNLLILVLSSIIFGTCVSEKGDLEGSESSQSYGYGYGTKVADQVRMKGSVATSGFYFCYMRLVAKSVAANLVVVGLFGLSYWSSIELEINTGPCQILMNPLREVNGR
jgi:hypothetical protein